VIRRNLHQQHRILRKFGFKLHIIINYLGEIVSVKLTPANVDDCTPVLEYVVTLITNVRKNMKAKAISAFDKAMLARRFIIETINDRLKK